MAELTKAPDSEVGSGRGRADELDELTLRRAQRGDDDACRALVVRYQGPVFALLSRTAYGAAASEVEDLAQETFLQVFRALPRFSPTGPARLSTWILTIASRRAIDCLRRRPIAHAPLESAPEPIAAEQADHGARQAWMAARVNHALAELAPEYRAAFILRAFHELEYSEISTALDIDIGTVKSRLARARARMAELLAEGEQ